MNFFHCVKQIVIAVSLVTLIAGCGLERVEYRTPYKKTTSTQRPYKINGKTYYPIDSSRGYWERGTASWYGKKFHGRKTANGETYNMYAKTAAHKTLPMNTVLLVRNLENGRETVVRINDRGPFSKKRIIDLSYTAANELDIVRPGIAKTEIIALGESTGSSGTKGGGPGKLKYQDFTTGDFYIQLGSFINRNNAEKLARIFTSRGMKVLIQPYETNVDRYYRVQVFAGTSLHYAKRLENQFLEKGYAEAFVVAR